MDPELLPTSNTLEAIAARSRKISEVSILKQPPNNGPKSKYHLLAIVDMGATAIHE